MREIKFRAWDDDNEKMYYSGSLEFIAYDFAIGCCIGITLKEGWSNHYHYSASLMQYTGLKDKNGKEIYEGDILSHELPYKCDKCEQTHIIGVVEWDVDGWFLKCISEGDHKIYDSMGMIYDWEDREIIGNIYENKELLK